MLDVSIIMCKNKESIKEPNFWDNCNSGFAKNNGIIDFTHSAELYYSRKFGILYSSMASYLKLKDKEWSDPLSKEDIEYMIHIATHYPDYWNDFTSVPDLCRILYYYDLIQKHDMVLLFGAGH